MKDSPSQRILWVDHVNRILGGAEVNLVELLADEEPGPVWDSMVACDPSGRLHEALTPLGTVRHGYGFDPALGTLRVVGSRFPIAGALRSLRALAGARRELGRIMEETRPDVVVSCTNKDHFAAGPVCRRLGIPSVWWVNDILSAEFFPWLARRAFVRAARRNAGRMIVVSDYARRALESQRVPDRVTTIHNGIPLSRYQRRARGMLQDLVKLPGDASVIGILGRFTPWKGQDVFLEIADAWCRRHAHGHFVLIGHAFNEDQPFEQRLREFVASRGLQERVQFVPFQKDVVSALSDLDLLLHVSKKPEPFGRVIIEAMALGIPVIAARDGGVPEIITHGTNGLLATPGVCADYLTLMESLDADPAFRQRLAANARETVASRFSLARVREDFDRVFRETSAVPR